MTKKQIRYEMNFFSSLISAREKETVRMSDDDNLCLSCQEAIEEKDGDVLVCASVCGRSIHRTCTTIDKNGLKAVNNHENITYSCDECTTYSLKAVNNKVNGLYTIIARLEKKIEEMMKRSCVDQAEKSIENGEPNMSYADVAKKKKVMVVRPKEKEMDSKKVKTLMRENVDPALVKFGKVRGIANGGLVIECDNNESAEKLKEIAAKKLGNEISVEEAKEKRSVIKIVGMDKEYEKEELACALKAQNELLKEDNNLQILRIYNVKRDKYNYWCAIVALLQKNAKVLVERGSIYVGWERCKVYEDIRVSRCGNCYAYNHATNKCKNPLACRKCGSNHKEAECRETEWRCVNCVILKDKTRVDINVNHKVSDPECPVRKKKLEAVKRAMAAQ